MNVMFASVLGNAFWAGVGVAVVLVLIFFRNRRAAAQQGLIGRVADVGRAQAGEAVRNLELENAEALRRQQREDLLKSAQQKLQRARLVSGEDQILVTRKGNLFKKAAQKVNNTTNEIATLKAQAKQMATDAQKPGADAELMDGAIAVAGQVQEAEARLPIEQAERDRLQNDYNQALDKLKASAQTIRESEQALKALEGDVKSANRYSGDGGAATKSAADDLEETVGQLREEIDVVNENANTGMIVEGRDLRTEAVIQRYTAEQKKSSAAAKLDEILGKKPAATQPETAVAS